MRTWGAGVPSFGADLTGVWASCCRGWRTWVPWFAEGKLPPVRTSSWMALAAGTLGVTALAFGSGPFGDTCWFPAELALAGTAGGEVMAGYKDLGACCGAWSSAWRSSIGGSWTAWVTSTASAAASSWPKSSIAIPCWPSSTSLSNLLWASLICLSPSSNSAWVARLLCWSMVAAWAHNLLVMNCRTCAHFLADLGLRSCHHHKWICCTLLSLFSLHLSWKR